MHSPSGNNLLHRLLGMSIVAGAMLAVVPGAALPLAGQQQAPAAVAAGKTVVPPLVRYTGVAAHRAGDAVEMEFRIYAQAEGGEPLWAETQRVEIGQDGKYSALLGAATVGGIPAAVFAAGEGRWLGVSIERSSEPPRSPLVSVAYAMKAGDADTVGGIAAQDLVTRTQLAADQAAASELSSSGPASPAVAPSGSGTAGALALWTNTTALGSSAIHQEGTASAPLVGVDITAPAALLDVNGTGIYRKTLELTTRTAATAKTGVDSPMLTLNASSYLKNQSKPISQSFAWQAIATNNDTSSPSANLSLLYGQIGATPTATGLSISPNGVINFSPSQTFPVQKGAITGIKVGSGLSGGGTSGTVEVGIDVNTLAPKLVPDLVSALPSTLVPAIVPGLEATFAQLGGANTFSQPQTVNSTMSVAGASGEGPLLSVASSGSYGQSSAISASNGTQYATGIYATATVSGIGIQGYAGQSAGAIGILGGLNETQSNTYFTYESNDGYTSGIWADGIDGSTSALIATADSTNAGVFINDSASAPTLYAGNLGGGATGLVATREAGLATVLRTEGPGGVCGINQAGSMACTGQIKALVATRDGARRVETYSVQSAENWLEDYGTGQLQGGAATVALDPAFAETVNAGAGFHVFLTPGGDCKGLYVTNKTATSFEVHELGGGQSSIAFDYKIVARRTGHEGERLVDVTERMKLESEAAHPKPRAGARPANFRPPAMARATASAQGRPN